ncbi:MAG: hypothetical protein ACT4QC_23550 [Planctomycetaceae bacterium]
MATPPVAVSNPKSAIFIPQSVSPVPARFDDTFDYLTLLGFDPATVAFQPVDELREAIKRKKKEWTGQAINPLYQQQARANLERAGQFERILDAPEALQAYLNYQSALGAERQAEQESILGDLLAHAAGAGRKSLTVGQKELLRQACDERQIPLPLLDEVIAARGLKVVEDPPATGTSMPYRQPALDRALMSQIDGHLRILGRQSFYDLLDLPADSSPARLVATAHILYDRWSKALPKTSECVAWEKSLQAALTYLKDDEAKGRYDRARFNRRLDQFVWRIDLALASGHFTREDFTLAATAGVREFGLSNETVNQCVRLRAAARGLSMTKPVQIVVETQGLVRCQRCFRYVSADQRRCTQCGCEFDSVCRNPACGERLKPDAKTCRRCGLRAARGVQFRELLNLALALVNAGDATGSLRACGLAKSILDAPAVGQIAERAARVRTLVASIRRAAVDKRWSRVERELPDLVTLAPRFAQPGLPKLEQVGDYLAQFRQRLAAVSQEADAENQSLQLLEILSRWSDCAEAIERLQALADALESAGRHQPALDVIRRLADLEPLNEQLEQHAARLTRNLAERQAEAERVERLLHDFREAFATDRLYAAQRLLSELDGLGAAAPIADAAGTLKARIARVQAELGAARDAETRGAPSDNLIDRHLKLLELCRDCRESLAALQTLRPAAPESPRDVRVLVQGNRRVVTWQPPATGPAPTMFVVERSRVRPGSARSEEPAWRSLGEVLQPLFLDDEVLHSGTIVCYAVRSLRRGALTVAGSVLQEFSVSSPPAGAAPALLWQDVLGLRARVSHQRVDLRWHAPAGARQVLIERWPGPPVQRPETPELLATPAQSHYSDPIGPDAAPCTYRVYCVYDGAEGDFATPGTLVAVVPGREPEISSASTAPHEKSADDAVVADVLDQAPQLAAAAASRESNPLKRLGLWPPVSKPAGQPEIPLTPNP